MKRITLVIIILITSLAASAQNSWGAYMNSEDTLAKMVFKNKSDYTMTLKIIYQMGGLYRTFTLRPQSEMTLSFSQSDTFKLKIKAVHNDRPSYHDGGEFSVTRTRSEWSEGEISLRLSTYGSGLGPSISQEEFNSNQ